MVLEAAVNGRAEAIATFNARDFAGVAHEFGIALLTPNAWPPSSVGAGCWIWRWISVTTWPVLASTAKGGVSAHAWATASLPAGKSLAAILQPLLAQSGFCEQLIAHGTQLQSRQHVGQTIGSGLSGKRE
jgi:hypothetical protein